MTDPSPPTQSYKILNKSCTNPNECDYNGDGPMRLTPFILTQKTRLKKELT